MNSDKRIDKINEKGNNNKMSIPDFAFLGITERAEHITESHLFSWRYNILGLRDCVFTYVFPMNLKGLKFVFMIHNVDLKTEKNLVIRSEDNNEILKLHFLTFSNDSSNKQILPTSTNNKSLKKQKLRIIRKPIWTLFIWENDADAIIKKPEELNIFLIENQKETIIGTFYIMGLTGPPYSDEFISSLKLNPLALKEVRMVIECKKCSSKFVIYTGISRNESVEKEGHIWFQDLEDCYICECGNINIDLQSIKNNLHLLLEGRTTKHGEYQFNRLYDDEKLTQTLKEFTELINNGNTTESKMHHFINDNRIILQTFSSQNIVNKAPILNKFETDFAIINNKKELILIEIERPGKFIMKKDGGVRATLQQAIDQVRDWLYLVKEERSAVLKMMGISPTNVTSIKGVVIMGRDNDYQEEKLRKFKGQNFGDVEFYTFDDLRRNFAETIRLLRDL